MFSDDIAEWLATQVGYLTYDDVGATGNIYVDTMPSKPDRSVTVYVNGGGEADARLPYDPVNVQFLFRSDSGNDSWAKQAWQDVYTKVHGLGPTQIGGTLVAFMLVTNSSPVPIGDDSFGRGTYSMVVRAEIINPTDRRSL